MQQQTIADPTHQYFLEIAFGSEFGSKQTRIKKWQKNIHLQIKGQPTETDLQTLKQVITELNGLITPEITITQKDANMEMHFVPERRFSEIDKYYRPVNLGYFWTWWNPATYEIFRARILISSTGITQQERNHLIREELTQSMGLMNDSQHYPDSIFYQPWSRVTDYSKIDKEIIKLLYQSEIRPGMSKRQTLNKLTAIQ